MPTKMIPLPSFDRLNELLSYNPERGQLRWKVSRSNVKAGSAAGHIHTGKDGRKDRMVKIDGKAYTSTRIIWMMCHHEDPGSLSIDHINRDTLDNRIVNLRLATAHEQNMNTKCTSPSTAVRYRGLVIHSNKNRCNRPFWQGKIKISRHHYYFGSAPVSTINDPAPKWLIDRAACIYDMHNNPAISDEALIKEIAELKSQRNRCSRLNLISSRTEESK